MDPREDLVRHYRWLRQFGINDSHSGNASVRDGDRLWVTPTGACADTLTIHDLVPCSLVGAPPAGSSLDTPLHQAVYRASPGTGAVVHSHGAHTVAVTLQGEHFIPVDFEGQLYFPEVPVLTIAFADYVAQAPARVAATLRDFPVCVVRGHGVYARGETLNLAYKWTCSLELSARTFLLARQAGTL